MNSQVTEQWGIYSKWSKKFCFGIAAPSKQQAWKELFRKIGKDAYKWRFEARKLPIPINNDRRRNANMANEIATKMVTGKVRLSYANIWEPKENDQGQLKYSCALLIPKSDKDTLRKIKSIVDALKEEAATKYKGKLPANFKLPLHDGDEEKPEDENYAGHYFLNAYANSKPGIAKPIGKDSDGKIKFQEITDTTEVYSGCYAKVSINFYLYDNKSKGIGVGLNNIVKVQDGESLAGRSSVNEDFANEDFDNDFNDEDDENFLN